MKEDIFKRDVQVGDLERVDIGHSFTKLGSDPTNEIQVEWPPFALEKQVTESAFGAPLQHLAEVATVVNIEVEEIQHIWVGKLGMEAGFSPTAFLGFAVLVVIKNLEHEWLASRAPADQKAFGVLSKADVTERNEVFTADLLFCDSFKPLLHSNIKFI